MPESITHTQRGNTVIVWFTSYDEDENLADLDGGATVEVWHGGIRVFGPANMTRWGIGTYRYELATDAMPAGDYRVVCRGVLMNKSVVQDTPLVITEPWRH